MEPKLIYIGNGAAMIGVPARDLTEQDFITFGLKEAELLNSGLYKKPSNEQQPAPKKGKAGKDGE
jgi:hypothetical protein